MLDVGVVIAMLTAITFMAAVASRIGLPAAVVLTEVSWRLRHARGMDFLRR